MTVSLDEIKSTIMAKGGLARTNKFLIELPQISRSVSSRNLNVLCRSATIPGKGISTLDRKIGMEFEKIAYGYIVDDVSLTFLVPQDYSVVKYFDTWKSQILDEERQIAGYKNNYQKPVKIHALSEGIPSIHVGAEFKIGPLPINLGKSFNFPGVQISKTAYSVELIDAYPTRFGDLQFNNEADGFVEYTVGFSYTNWRRARSSQISFKL